MSSPSEVYGGEPQQQSNLVHFALKYDTRWQQFGLFSWESTDRI